MITKRRRAVAEKQVLFRLDEDVLAKLDRKVAQKGFKTRNAWFKAIVRDFVGDRRK